MNQAYTKFSRTAAVVFFLFMLYPLSTKLLEGRLAGDWLHSLLHLLYGLLGVYAGWFASNAQAPRLYTAGIAFFYLALGLFGWLSPGLFLGTPLAVPLGIVDNLFHLGLALPAWGILILDLSSKKSAAS